jgi:hypothetical protein
MFMASVAATTVAIATLTGSGAPPAAPPLSTEVLTYHDVRQQTEFLDTGSVGGAPTAGDSYFFDSTLRYPDRGDAATRRDAGRFLSTCTVLFQSHVSCSGSLLLRNGTIEIAATPDLGSGSPIAAAITGGTGRYDSAAGSVTITPTETEGTSILVARVARRVD